MDVVCGVSGGTGAGTGVGVEAAVRVGAVHTTDVGTGIASRDDENGDVGIELLGLTGIDDVLTDNPE
jgi:hypothetical protein